MLKGEIALRDYFALLELSDSRANMKGAELRAVLREAVMQRLLEENVAAFPVATFPVATSSTTSTLGRAAIGVSGAAKKPKVLHSITMLGFCFRCSLRCAAECAGKCFTQVVNSTLYTLYSYLA